MQSNPLIHALEYYTSSFPNSYCYRDRSTLDLGPNIYSLYGPVG